MEPRTLCARRTDVAADWNRAINRLRAQLLKYFPALERAFDYAHRKGALILLTGYQTPEALRRIGRTRLEKWLRGDNAYNWVAIADRAIAAANAQHVVVTGQRLGSTIVARIAQQILDIDEELSDLDDMIEERFTQHQQAAVIRSMPGSVLCWEPNCRGHQRRPGQLPQRRPARRRRRPGTRTARLRTHQREPQNDPADTTVDCCASSTWPPTTALKPAPNPGRTTTVTR